MIGLMKMKEEERKTTATYNFFVKGQKTGCTKLQVIDSTDNEFTNSQVMDESG